MPAAASRSTPTTGVVTVADGSLLDYETRDQPQHHRPGLRRLADHLQSFTIAVSDVAEPATAPDSDDAAGGTRRRGRGQRYRGRHHRLAPATPTAARVTYCLTDDAGGRFAIDANTGVVTVADGSLLDYETRDQPLHHRPGLRRLD